MAIDTNKNTRLALTMNKELHSIVKEYADKENRKVSNFIINLFFILYIVLYI